jgi:ribosomal protein S12 methylthiotransferase accessory factor
MPVDARQPEASRTVPRVDIVPVPTGSRVCTANGTWLSVPLPAERVAGLLRGRAAPQTHEAAAWGQFAERLAAEGGGWPPAGGAFGQLLATGDIALCRRIRDHDGSGLLRGLTFVEPVDLPQPGSGSQPDFILVIERGYRGLLAPGAADRLSGYPWLACSFVAEAVCIGPLTDDKHGATFADLVARRTANALHAEHVRGRDTLHLGEWGAGELSWAISVLAMEISRFFQGHECASAEHEMVLSPATLTITRHRVLPLPFNSIEPATPNPRRYRGQLAVAEIVDSRVGVIRQLRTVKHHPSVPESLHTVHAGITDMSRISPWLTDPVAGGSSFDCEGAARSAAIGEAVERYSGEIVQTRLLCQDSWRAITSRGEEAVDPETLELFSARQYATPGFPFVPLTRDLVIHWVRGRCLSGGYPAWLPASLVYPNWYVGPFAGDPVTNNPYYPGLAAGPDLEFAIAAGIQEIIERDATMIWWANSHKLPRVRPPASLRRLWDGKPEQNAWLIHLDNEFGVPVMAGLVENISEQLFTMGFAARADPAAAALKAWAEALTLQEMARDLLNPAGAYRGAVARGAVNGAFVKAWRADRRYLDDYRDDLRDAVDLMCQMQIYLDPRAVARVRSLVDPAAQVNMADLPRLPDGSRRTYQSVVEARGFSVHYADLTTPDVAATGMRVVRVLIPGMVPNYAAAFPFHGRGRLRDAAVSLGWRSVPLNEEETNLFPIAHA